MLTTHLMTFCCGLTMVSLGGLTFKYLTAGSVLPRRMGSAHH